VHSKVRSRASERGIRLGGVRSRSGGGRIFKLTSGGKKCRRMGATAVYGLREARRKVVGGGVGQEKGGD